MFEFNIYIFLLSIVFGIISLAIIYRLTNVFISPYRKASTQKRFFAAAVDSAVCYSLAYFAFFYENIYSSLLFASYILLKDVLFKGQSIGKLLSGLVVIRIYDGKPCRLPQSLVRNFLFAIPGINLVALGVEVYLIFKDRQGLRLGDRLAKTQVIEGKELPEVAKWFQLILDYFNKIANAEQSQKEPAQIGENR